MKKTLLLSTGLFFLLVCSFNVYAEYYYLASGFDDNPDPAAEDAQSLAISKSRDGVHFYSISRRHCYDSNFLAGCKLYPEDPEDPEACYYNRRDFDCDPEIQIFTKAGDPVGDKHTNHVRDTKIFYYAPHEKFYINHTKTFWCDDPDNGTSYIPVLSSRDLRTWTLEKEIEVSCATFASGGAWYYYYDENYYGQGQGKERLFIISGPWACKAQDGTWKIEYIDGTTDLSTCRNFPFYTECTSWPDSLDTWTDLKPIKGDWEAKLDNSTNPIGFNIVGGLSFVKESSGYYALYCKNVEYDKTLYFGDADEDGYADKIYKAIVFPHMQISYLPSGGENEPFPDANNSNHTGYKSIIGHFADEFPAGPFWIWDGTDNQTAWENYWLTVFDDNSTLVPQFYDEEWPGWSNYFGGTFSPCDDDFEDGLYMVKLMEIYCDPGEDCESGQNYCDVSLTHQEHYLKGITPTYMTGSNHPDGVSVVELADDPGRYRVFWPEHWEICKDGQDINGVYVCNDAKPLTRTFNGHWYVDSKDNCTNCLLELEETPKRAFFYKRESTDQGVDPPSSWTAKPAQNWIDRFEQNVIVIRMDKDVIAGRVTDTYNLGVPCIRITLSEYDNSTSSWDIVSTTTTDADGNYSFLVPYSSDALYKVHLRVFCQDESDNNSSYFIPKYGDGSYDNITLPTTAFYDFIQPRPFAETDNGTVLYLLGDNETEPEGQTCFTALGFCLLSDNESRPFPVRAHASNQDILWIWNNCYECGDVDAGCDGTISHFWKYREYGSSDNHTTVDAAYWGAYVWADVSELQLTKTYEFSKLGYQDCEDGTYEKAGTYYITRIE